MAKNTGYAVATNTPQTPTVASLAGMSPADRQAAMSQLSPAQQAQTQAMIAAHLADAKHEANYDYMTRALRRIATMPPTGGGLNAAYTAGGSQLIFDFPTASGGFAKEVIVSIVVNYTLAAGSAAVYQLNAAAPWSLIQYIDLNFGGNQSRLRPVVLKYLHALKGVLRSLGAEGNVIAGNSITTVQNGVQTSLPIAVGAQTATFKFRIPLNALHPLSPAGMIPIQASGAKAQLKLTIPANLFGTDPLDNVFSAASGTGHAISAVSGTVTCECVYTDGVNLQDPNPLRLDLDGEPTAQYFIDNPVTNMASGQRGYNRIATLLPHYYVIACIVDGVQPTKFATIANIAGMDLSVDQVGQNKFFQYGQGVNQPVNDFFIQLREIFQQDPCDEGIIPWVYAPSANQGDPGNLEGQAVLNMAPGSGWTDVNHGYILTTVGNNSVARVETWLVSINPAGLQLG